MITPDGKGYAHFLTDYGMEADHLWTVLISEGPKAGQFWSYENPLIRLPDNISLGRITKVDVSAKPVS